jgi:hypothetical protein
MRTTSQRLAAVKTARTAMSITPSAAALAKNKSEW